MPLIPERKRRSVAAIAFTAAVHVIVLAVLFLPRAMPAVAPEPAPIEVSLIEAPKPPGPPNDAANPGGADMVDPVTPPPVPAPSMTIEKTVAVNTSDLLTASQIAGAANAGEGGGGGGGCNMAQLVQQALRSDPQVRRAVEESGRVGQAIMLWNGDWVRSGEQEGKGLATVRQAIAWKVAFAPEPCRNTRVQGLVLLSLADRNTRFAIGDGDWRWSDLLDLQSVRR